MWSLGVIFYEIIFGKPPFYGKSIISLLTDIKQQIYNKDLIFPSDMNVNSNVKDLL